MSGTLRDLLFWSRILCFECKNHRWGLGPTDTSNSDARHAVLHAENHRWGLGPIDTSNCGHKVTVLKAQNHRWGLEPIEPSSSDANHGRTCTKGKVMSGTHRDLFFWSRSRCFECKNHRWGLGPTETCNSSPKVAVLHAQNHRWGMEPI